MAQHRLGYAVNGRVHRPETLSLAQIDPVVNDVRLIRFETQALRQTGQGLGIVPVVFVEAPEIVQRQQQYWPLIRVGPGDVALDPEPFGDRRVVLTFAFVDLAKIEVRLGKGRRQLDGMAIGLLGAANVVFVAERDAEVEVDEVIVRRLVALQPGLVQHDRKRIEAACRQFAGGIEQCHDIELALPGKHSRVGKIGIGRKDHGFT